MEMIDPSNFEKSHQIITWSSEELGLGHAKFYKCSFCKRGFSNAQALGGHMNIHRRDRARLREFSSDQNLLSLDINNSISSPPPPNSAHDDSLQREVSSSYDEIIISSPSRRPCVTYEENDHSPSKVNYDHNPPPRPSLPFAHAPAHDVSLQREVSSYDEIIITSTSKRPCVTYEENDHPSSKVTYDHNPPPRPPPANDDSLQRDVSSYDEIIISSSLKRPCVTYDEENDHLVTSKVNYYDHNHDMIIGDLLQLPLFKETPLVEEASNCADEQVANKGMQQNPNSELDLELRLGMEPPESSIEMGLQFELHRI